MSISEQTALLQPSPPHSTVHVNVDNVSDDDAIVVPCPPPPPTVDVKADAYSFLYLVFLFSWLAYIAPRDDMPFVFLCYAILLSLFCCLRKYERLDSDAPPYVRRVLKAVMLLLAAVLNVAFAYRASALVPSWPFAVVVWASAAFATLIGFFSLFVRSNRVGGVDNIGALPYSKLDSNSNSNNNNNNCNEEEEKYLFHDELSPEDKA